METTIKNTKQELVEKLINLKQERKETKNLLKEQVDLLVNLTRDTLQTKLPNTKIKNEYGDGVCVYFKDSSYENINSCLTIRFGGGNVSITSPHIHDKPQIYYQTAIWETLLLFQSEILKLQLLHLKEYELHNEYCDSEKLLEKCLGDETFYKMLDGESIQIHKQTYQIKGNKRKDGRYSFLTTYSQSYSDDETITKLYYKDDIISKVSNYVRELVYEITK